MYVICNNVLWSIELQVRPNNRRTFLDMTRFEMLTLMRTCKSTSRFVNLITRLVSKEVPANHSLSSRVKICISWSSGTKGNIVRINIYENLLVIPIITFQLKCFQGSTSCVWFRNTLHKRKRRCD